MDEDRFVRLGFYSVKASNGKDDIKLLPLEPGTTVEECLREHESEIRQLAPNEKNKIVVGPRIGIFDIKIEFIGKDDPFTGEEISEKVIKPAKKMSGKPTHIKTPIVQEDGLKVNICFAVIIPKKQDSFAGKLLLEATPYKKTKTWKKKDGTAASKEVTVAPKAELKLKVNESDTVADMFVAFNVHESASAAGRSKYCWFKLKATNYAGGGIVTDAEVKMKVLRDNQANGFNKCNRQVGLTSGADGFLSYTDERSVIGILTGWPIIFNAEREGFFGRAHMLRLKSSDDKNNLEPYRPTENLRMMPLDEVTRMLGDPNNVKRLVLDPGHGVVYHHKQRRSQEWLVANKLAEHIAFLLAGYGMPAQNILFTRTAGLGLIEPGLVHSREAPETGNGRYQLDYDFNLSLKSTQAGDNPKLGLHSISDMLQTMHERTERDDDDLPIYKPIPLTEDERKAFLDLNAAVIARIVERKDGELKAHHQKVEPGSVRWDPTKGRYIYTKVRTNAKPDRDPVVGDAVFTITKDDKFQAKSFLDVLAMRSVCWSMCSEIGSGPEAEGNRLAFPIAARAAMEKCGAFEYMYLRVMRSLEMDVPHPKNNWTMGWSPGDRSEYFRYLETGRLPKGWHRHTSDDVASPCALYLTLHENAAGTKKAIEARGAAAMMAQTSPPDRQINIGKIFVKYVDVFNHGLRQGGIAYENENGGVGLLQSTNPIRDKYAYLEVEFMDAYNPDHQDHYVYETMVTEDYIQVLAQQVVNGIIEAMLDPQADLENISYDPDNQPW